ncbi:MAG TPA: PKD domain-containing protein, partial [Chitinophagaceae bacterium]|nr:PKD domain-containing protein [Chitinophagaceae bacterium]
MKKILFLIIVSITGFLIFISCTDKSPTPAPPVANTPSNRPPVANAGNDASINLPANTVNLDGSASDPDNNISAYQWTKVDGPSSFSIVHANSLTIQAANLVEGVYQFELKVTDAGGLFAKDT